MSNMILEVKNLSIQFTPTHKIHKKKFKKESDNANDNINSDSHVVDAVKNISFSIEKGERVAIVGESGSGKSTTAHAIINLLPGTGKITSGDVIFDGEKYVDNSSVANEAKYVKMRGSGIGLVPQDPLTNLNPVWRIGFQVEEALKANSVSDESGKKLSGKSLKKAAAEVLKKAGLDDAERRMKQYPHEFSGGMRQRVLIGIALAASPKLLIADEPTSALDVTVQKVILDHLDSLTKDMGTAMLFITHDLGLAAERADKIIVMFKGEIVESGKAIDILKNPQHPYTKRLIGAAPSLSHSRLKSTKKPIITSSQKTDDSNERKSENAIEFQNITKEFTIRGQKEKLIAVNDISFCVPSGKTTAIVGESGSGKSTIANMALGLFAPTSGKILFEGEDLNERLKSHAQRKQLRRKMQSVFQNPYGSLDPMYSIGSSIEEPLKVHKIGDKTERKNRVSELLDLVHLPSALIHRYPSELSGGQRQRVAIARALALHPDVLILDEAVSALDVLVQQQILELLNDLQTEFSMTYLFVTHDLAVVNLIADQAVVMEKGKLVEIGKTTEVFNNPQKEYTQKLLDAIPGKSII